MYKQLMVAALHGPAYSTLCFCICVTSAFSKSGKIEYATSTSTAFCYAIKLNLAMLPAADEDIDYLKGKKIHSCGKSACRPSAALEQGLPFQGILSYLMAVESQNRDLPYEMLQEPLISLSRGFLGEQAT